MYIKQRSTNSILNVPNASIVEIVMMACIFLGAMNFANRYFFCVFIGFIVFVISPGRKINMDMPFALLMLLSAALLLFDKFSFNNALSAIKPFTFPICYIWGKSYLSGDTADEKYLKKLESVVLTLAAGCLAHYALNYISNIGVDSRNTTDFWTQMVAAATVQAIIVCITMGVAVAYLFSDVNWKKKTFAVVSLIIIFLYNLVLSGRTSIIFFAIMCVVAYVFRAISEKRKIFRTLIYFAIAGAIIMWIYESNIFGIKDIVEDSLLYDRFFGDWAMETTEDSRLDAKIYYLKHMWEHPFGGGVIHKAYGGYAHDLYFDTYDVGGFAALIGVGFYAVSSILRMVHFARSPFVDFNTKQVVVCVYTILHIQFWTEPIVYGAPWLFASFCLIDGFVAGFLERHKQKKEMQAESKYIKKKKSSKYLLAR